MPTKRILCLGDFHCGHEVGLTPPGWWQRIPGLETPDGPSLRRLIKRARLQRATWGWFRRTVNEIGPVFGVIGTGDYIDGRGEKSGGTELITTDREEQADMATACFREALRHSPKAKISLVYGTHYHASSNGEDHENAIAKEIGCHIGAHEWVECNGCTIDVKHHIGTSAIPHGRHTAISRDEMWNALWAERKLQPRANVVIRGHAHYLAFSGNAVATCIICPALQAMGSKFGARRCSGLVDLGLLVLDIDDCGRCQWHAELADLRQERTRAERW